MSTNQALPPVKHHVRVTLSPHQAFDLFTQQMARWWPFRGHSCYGDDAADVQFEPRVGGAVTELARDGDRMPWGRIIEWSPPHGFAMHWHPGLPEAEATVLRVSFVAMPHGGTEVSVHHSGWHVRGDQAAAKRDQYDGGWPATLAAYVAGADSLRSAT
jgi:uncharacterized protein YndB with AHSA1/START domain